MLFFQFGEVLTSPGKQLKGETLNGDKVVTTVGGKLKSPLPLVLQQFIPCNTFSKLCPTPAVGSEGVQHLWKPLWSQISAVWQALLSRWLACSIRRFRSGPQSHFGSAQPCTTWLLDITLLLIWRRLEDVDFAGVSAPVSRHSFSVSSSVSPPADHLEWSWLLDWVVWTERQTRSSQHSFTSRGYTGICCPQWVGYILHFSLTYKQIKTYRTLFEETSSFADKVALQCAALQNIEF